MSDQTAAGISTRKTLGTEGTDLRFTPNERQLLRRLAEKVAELAARPGENEKRKLWYRINALEPGRPVIFCDPENGWKEIITSAQLKCTNKLARHWEMTLRKEIFWGEQMRDDRVIEPDFNVAYHYQETDWGMCDTKIGGHNGGSYTWEAPLKDYQRDFAKLKFPQIQVDYELTHRIIQHAETLFGDLLNVRLKGVWWWTLGMTWTLITLRGLSNFMFDFYEHPNELHRLLAFLRDGHVAKLDFLEANGLLSLNNNGTYVGSGGFGYTHELPQKDFSGKVRLQDLWGFGESQETVSVSPHLFEEFIFPYQLAILSRFGLNCYGCCEPVDGRWLVLKKIPNLRRVSVSPWANVEKMAEFLGDQFIYSRKPAPTDIAVANPDWEKIRADLRNFIRVTRNCRVEIIMKDNHTIAHNPLNVIKWCQIAREEAERA